MQAAGPPKGQNSGRGLRTSQRGAQIHGADLKKYGNAHTGPRSGHSSENNSNPTGRGVSWCSFVRAGEVEMRGVRVGNRPRQGCGVLSANDKVPDSRGSVEMPSGTSLQEVIEGGINRAL